MLPCCPVRPLVINQWESRGDGLTLESKRKCQNLLITTLYSLQEQWHDGLLDISREDEGIVHGGDSEFTEEHIRENMQTVCEDKKEITVEVTHFIWLCKATVAP